MPNVDSSKKTQYFLFCSFSVKVFIQKIGVLKTYKTKGLRLRRCEKEIMAVQLMQTDDIVLLKLTKQHRFGGQVVGNTKNNQYKIIRAYLYYS